MKPLIFFVLGVCGLFACYWALTGLRSTENEQQAKITQAKDKFTKWETRYKRLLKTKRVFIPVPVYNVTDCEAELETCTRALSAIKLWCDPTCKQELSECLRILQGCSSRPYWQTRY